MGVRQAYARRKKNNLKSLYFHLVVLADGGSIGWVGASNEYLLITTLYYLEYVFTKDSGTMELNTKGPGEAERTSLPLSPFNITITPSRLLTETPRKRMCIKYSCI
jgi:hypothetical protein